MVDFGIKGQKRNNRNKGAKAEKSAKSVKSGTGVWWMWWGEVALEEIGCNMMKMSFLYRMIRGAVGRKFVVKHYKGGRIVITKFPDMSGIVVSGKQRERRDLFREAVAYARWIVGDEERKRAFRKTLSWKKRKHVYQAAIRLYMRMQGDQQWLRKQLAVKEVVRGMKGEGVKRVFVKSETSNVNGFLVERGKWSVIWQKGEKVGAIANGANGWEQGGCNKTASVMKTLSTV